MTFALRDAARVLQTRPAPVPEHAFTQGGRTKSRGIRQRQTVPWQEFEPIVNQIRISTGVTTAAEIQQAIGYSDSSMFAKWKKNGVPTVAMLAARGFLASMGVQAHQPIKRQFERDDLVWLLSAVAGLKTEDPQRGPLITRLAKEIAAS